MCLTLGLLIALVVFMASLDLLLFAICRCTWWSRHRSLRKGSIHRRWSHDASA